MYFAKSRAHIVVVVLSSRHSGQRGAQHVDSGNHLGPQLLLVLVLLHTTTQKNDVEPARARFAVQLSSTQLSWAAGQVIHPPARSDGIIIMRSAAAATAADSQQREQKLRHLLQSQITRYRFTISVLSEEEKMLAAKLEDLTRENKRLRTHVEATKSRSNYLRIYAAYLRPPPTSRCRRTKDDGEEEDDDDDGERSFLCRQARGTDLVDSTAVRHALLHCSSNEK